MNKKVKKVLLVILTIILIVILSVVGFSIYFIKSKLNKINFEELNEQDLSLNLDLYKDLQDSNSNSNLTEEEFNSIKTIAIFGSDSRNLKDAYDDGRSDCIIIFSLNPVKKKINLISIPRDTYVQIPGYEKTKINHAFAYGQEQLAVKTINENFGLNISEYVTVNWEAVTVLVDMVGGIDLNITEAERNFINQYIDYTAENSNGDKTKLRSSGYVHLNGTQVLTHCRDRYVGNDFTRAERQRTSIITLMEKIGTKDLNEINNIIDEFLPYVKTNVDILKYSNYIKEVWENKDAYFSNIVSEQIPSTEQASGQMLHGVYFFVPNDYEVCKKSFMEYLYEK